MLGKPWLSKPIKPDTEVKTLSLCPNCNCMTKTIDGACGKCKGTKMKTDWEDRVKNIVLGETKSGKPYRIGDEGNTFSQIKSIVDEKLLEQEEQHKEAIALREISSQILSRRIKQLKQQHIKQRKTLSDIHWEHLKRVKQQHRADLVSLIKRIEDVGLTPNGTRMIVLSNSEWIEIKEQLLNSQKGK